MSTLAIYLIVMLDNIRAFFITSTGILAGLFFIAGFIYLISEGEANFKYWKTLIVSLIVGGLACAFLPSTKQAAVIVILPAIANNETIQQESRELYDLGKEWLKETLSNNVPKIPSNKSREQIEREQKDEYENENKNKNEDKKEE